ncbi:MAG: hypothetical protein OI74_01165 [Gammaproteobacteria bacterium (ex Lamellibrachia satsuma)]|nr:MAG: hypothetical protein OI74_01165 [Gammaproteobacteria bacterium (ex Lamellibrachia satsuma)]RRS36600.1 MAG: hypothetical protein NV67_06835 [Gammaproteobacteria bacterium (ex Lamellibrachia satsuma)]
MSRAPRPRILLIAPSQSYRISAYLNAAREMGVAIDIASPGKHSLVRELAEGLHIDLNDPGEALDVICSAARSVSYNGVIATDDAAVELAALTASKLGLSFNSVHSSRLARRKDLARNCLRQAGIPVPQHQLISLADDLVTQIEGFPFPCVIKPLNLSASRGVIRANNLPEFLTACERIRPLIANQADLFERSHLLVEAYIDGFEVALEGFLCQGKLSVLALFDKPDPMVGPFFEETYYTTPSRLSSDVQHRILERVTSACEAYELVEGPVHAELRVSEDEAWILEVAVRTIGGECGHLFTIASGQALESLVIANAVGLPLPDVHIKGAAGVLMIPIPGSGMLREFNGVDVAQAVRYVEEVRIIAPVGHELVALPEGSSYLGFIFSKADTPEQAEAALLQAHEILSFKIDPVWRIS